jgi:hypothetical protein
MAMRVVAGLGLAICLCLSAAHAGSWRIVKDRWSEADETGFSRFVAAIGESKCSSSQSCLRDAANPFRGSDTRFLDIDTDCAKWPYLLRAYYAWKNGLPFSYVDGVAGSGDDRHSRNGNRPAGRRDFIDRGEGIDGARAVREVIDNVSSATYRSDAAQSRGILSDFYSPALQPGSIRPGTVIYDTNAHVGIVYKVDADGRIYYMDAHPDFTITRSVYGPQFGQSPAKLGGGLKNWRPLVLKGAHPDAEGHLLGGHMAMTPNAEIADFSLLQYTGTEPNPSGAAKQARFVYDGEAMGLYAYVRTALSGGKTQYNPLRELRLGMRSLCRDLKDRANAVELAVSKGIPEESHPSQLPQDIYDAGEDGWWESYATPARDARLRAAFAQFYRHMEAMIALWSDRDPRLVYDGEDLRGDFLKAYDEQSKACNLTYLNSARQPVPLDFDAVAKRLYALSFDPYDCVELRWGASGAERASCLQSPRKLRWYEAEQRLRSDPGRKSGYAYDLEELEALGGKGLAPPPPVDVKALLEAMPYQRPLEPMHPVGR